MSFADDLSEVARREPVLCKTGVWLAQLDDADRAAFQTHLASGRPVSDLWRVAVRHGCDAAETRFRAHCRNRCGCYTGEAAA
ncbi:hypothetical protein [Nocardia thailandica]|uniref:hypothetical protein n=1 Tax=Nocardia thailandica TaxID=257275 RepID=UPI00031EF8BE|nr:hypothetical protein [Nocardia thailandica]